MKIILFKAHNIKGEYRNCQICNKQFWAYRYKINQGGAKYCGRRCCGIANKGKHHSVTTEFKRGESPPKRYYPTGKDSSAWKEKVTYMHLHDWVREKKGKPTKCSNCGVMNKRIEWANINRKYNRNLNDFIAMCVSCHTKYDKALIKKCV